MDKKIKEKKVISIIIPAYNEVENVLRIYKALKKEWKKSMKKFYDYEIIFIDDGSTDETIKEIEKIAHTDEQVRFVEFSRNFGKEIATTAGIHVCTGDACIIIDADLQHPVELIPEFIEKWCNGFEVVIGVRKESKSDSWIKKIGGKVFYKIMRFISDVPIISHATDYRLLDRKVIDAFNELPERNRMTRGLIDWLGFKRGVIYFEANERVCGTASYSTWKLFRLAFTSVISLSMMPLRFAGYLGVIIMFASGALGIFMFVDRYFADWGFHFSGSAILADIILFLIGIVLISLGLLAFYIGHIYNECQGRQMYIIRNKK
ncbi:MAG: glycosyltransferase [Candidatus Moraniibacteriota bacterium]|nr:MAG: glycosyltransferase [Candidatus Moranbacteria bacterium]